MTEINILTLLILKIMTFKIWEAKGVYVEVSLDGKVVNVDTVVTG